MKLYDLELSGNCFKVRLFCALTQLPLEIYEVDYMGGEHKSDYFLGMNPLGQIPLFEDGDFLLRDSQAILVYLAQKHVLHDWWPQDAAAQAQVMQWLSFAANEIARGPNDARLHDLFGVELNVGLARERAEFCAAILDEHLSNNKWLVGSGPTIADIACYPYMALMHQGGVNAAPYLNLMRWMGDIRSLDGFVSMPGIE
ncbi:glutathione S-transferase family protein [Shewanella submarina]|uniref:Glutathione S-transferase family protein n=1 Tax=Shewanella submarina TaxID=2016376 RepID=A0ABV7GHN7_9GAMM|nr:glutathione S-transferase family protein [Shewanella submarina]MCL1035638.1 glutathione S-transferase family protein [Shewanella submarina]